MTDISLSEVHTCVHNEQQIQHSNAYNGTTILHLDDDSLFYILKQLSLRDQLSLVCADERFSTAFHMFAKAYIRCMVEYDFQNFDPIAIRTFFQIAGEYLETLTLLAGFEHNLCEYGFSLVKMHCPNLKQLSIWGNRDETIEHFQRLRELLDNKPKLKTLRLQRFCLKDDYMNLLTESELPQLEHLSIVHCSEFTGSSLKRFTKLKKLRLENLDRLNYNELQAALIALPNLYALSYLEAEICHKVSRNFAEVLNSLQLYNKNLKILELNMHNTRNVRVSQLPELKHFTYGIRDNSCLTTIDFGDLVGQKRNDIKSLRIVSFWDFQFYVEHCQMISQFTNLEKLHLPWKDLSKHGITINDDSLQHLCALQNLIEFKACGENSFTKHGLLNLVRSCRKLKWVNIQCSLIDNQFANELISMMQVEAKRPNGRLTFLVYGSKMKWSTFPEIFKTPKLKESVEFIFEELFQLESYNNCYDDFENDCNFIRTPFCAYC